MISKRIIPKLLMTMKEGPNGAFPVLVTTRQYQDRFEIGSPLSQAKIYQAQSADELMLLLIDRREDGIQQLAKVASEFANELFMPLCVGGNIRSVDDVKYLFDHGADKISVNQIAITATEKLTEIATVFGKQNVVVSVDFRRSGPNGEAIVWQEGGTKETELLLSDHCKSAEQLGAGEIVLTNIDRDGMSAGLDYEVAGELSEQLSVPLLLSGGCGVAMDFVDGFAYGKVDGICAGTFFASKDQNPIQARAQIRNAGFVMRTHF